MEQIGKYKVLRTLGSGGFGAVYLAEDPKLQEQVAIKVFEIKDDNLARLATSATSDAGDVLKQRFLNEAKTLRQLNRNPNIVDVFDFDELADGTPYYVMPYIPHSLKDELGSDATDASVIAELEPEEKPRRLPISQSLAYLEQLLRALKDVHKADLVHRDIKPANLLLNEHGEVQLCDFGIAKVPDADHSHSGVGMGSRNYMAPEQRQSAKHVDARSDIYAVGVIAYRMITGTLPEGRFADPNTFQPALSNELNSFILKALEQQKENRFANASEMLTEFKSLLTNDKSAEQEATGTWVEESTTEVKSELKPLKDKIIQLLQTQGEIINSDFVVLQALADIGQLDEEGLDALVSTTKEEQAKDPQQAAFQSWVASVNKAALQNQLEDANKKALLEAGLTSTGRNEALLEGILEEKGGEAKGEGQKSVGIQDGGSSAKSPMQSEQSSSGVGKWLSIAAVIAILGGGGFYGYDTFQKEKEAQRQAQIAQEAEQRAWNEAEQLNTIEAYEHYLSTWPKGKFQQQAENARDQIKEKARLAKLSEAQLRQEQVKRAQNLLKQLDYQVSETGDVDIRTKKAIETFEKSQKLLVTGSVDAVLIENLENTVTQKQDNDDWTSAKRTNTIAAYETYLTQWSSGEHRTAAQESIKGIQYENSKVPLSITTEPSHANIRLLNVKEKYSEGVRLVPGKLEIEVSAAGYKTKKSEVDLTANQNSFSFKLVNDIRTINRPLNLSRFKVNGVDAVLTDKGRGLIVTSYDSIRNRDEIFVSTERSKKINAVVIGIYEPKNFALLKINPSALDNETETTLDEKAVSLLGNSYVFYEEPSKLREFAKRDSNSNSFSLLESVTGLYNREISSLWIPYFDSKGRLGGIALGVSAGILDIIGSSDIRKYIDEIVQYGEYRGDKKWGLKKDSIPILSGDENEAYDRAVNFILKSKEYDKAIAQFQSFIVSFPNSNYLPNAHYWLGQLFTNKQQWRNASESFLYVIDNAPNSPRRPDAMFKMGFVHQRQGSKLQARSFFNRVIREYPDSTSAKLAKTRLKNL